MDAHELLEPFARMLAAIAPPSAVRAIEQGGDADAMWSEIAASGFLDALVDSESGGAGLSLAAVNPLWRALGAGAVPLPVGETMVARALLVGAGCAVPDGPIAIAVAAPGRTVVVPCGRVARQVLIDDGDALYLVDAASGAPAPTGVAADLAARMRWDDPASGAAIARPDGGLRPIAATLRAALIAGAADRVVEMTAAYANDRVQFGKPIGRQQALQQAMAVMAEAAVAARMASQIGCADGFPPAFAAAAVAKSIASRAAVQVAATAHAVHGAIGISAEHDLQLLTRRLHEWRLADGSESFWDRGLGALRLAYRGGSVEFVRTALPAAAADAG